MAIMAAERTSVVGVRFQKLGKLYHFKLGLNITMMFSLSDYVIVETKRGRQLGQVINFMSVQMRCIANGGCAPLSAKQIPAIW